MTNAEHELLNHIEKREVDYIKVTYRTSYEEPLKKIQGTLEQVLPLLDFEYNSRYGEQKLYGYIWYADGTWSVRGEYDGSEWWEHIVRPPMYRDIEE